MPNLRIKKLTGRAVMVPVARPLVNASGQLQRVPLVLIDLETDKGITGISYIFSPSAAVLKALVALVEGIEELVVGKAVAPQDLEQLLLGKFLLLGGSGLVTLAIAGLDMAAWDTLGKAVGTPLVRLWGGTPRPLPAYNSNGLGLIGAGKAGEETRALLDGGFRGVKLRLGYASLREDVEVTRKVVEAVGDDAIVVADYNQALTVAEAIRRGHALDDEGLYWIEEPIHADDYDGCARVARELKTPVQIGENFWSPRDLLRTVTTGAADLVMPDAAKIGGASAWLRAAAIAAAHGTPMSSHLFPEISAHMLAVTPTAHFLEYVDWAAPVLNEPVEVVDGFVTASERPGHGMSWNEDAIRTFLI
ncbi:enolase C-terminal domain-like protein [Rhizobium binxianense]